MKQTTGAMLQSPEFRRLVARRWAIALALTALLFLAYYGFILLVALDKELLARRIGAVTATMAAARVSSSRIESTAAMSTLRNGAVEWISLVAN